MKRGRRKDDPRDQRDKGYPSRRKSKTERQLSRMEAAAARDAELFASAGQGFDLQALPVFLADKRLAAAQVIWREYAPRLDRLHFLSTLDRYTFAMFCIYAAEFVLANKDLLDKGTSIMVTTIAGSRSGKGKAKSTGNQMPRRNPSLDIRDHAADMMLDLASKFGFTPLDRQKLIGQGARFDDETLFGRAIARDPAQPASPVEMPSPAAAEMVGSLATLDSPPPKTDRMN